MIRWIRCLWYKRLRAIDILILWPACKEKAPTLDHAKAAFATHAFRDPAWQFLDDAAIYKIIDALE